MDSSRITQSYCLRREFLKFRKLLQTAFGEEWGSQKITFQIIPGHMLDKLEEHLLINDQKTHFIP